MNRTWDRINFAAFLISNALSFGAMWGQRIVMGWLIWQLTGSPLWLAASASIELSSTFVLTPLVGVWLDRYRRDHILIVSQVVATIITGGFAAASIAEVLTPSLLIAVNATLGCAGAIYLPARLALLADVKGAPPSQSAHSALAIASQIGAFVGPTIIGIALSMHNASVAAALLCAFNAMATLTMLGIATKAPDHDVKSARTDQHTWRSAIAYWTASKTKVPTLLFIFFLTVVAVRGVMDLLPAYVAVVLTGDAELLSQLIAAAGFGALTTSLTLVPLGQCDPNRQIRLSLLLALTATVCMTVSPQLPSRNNGTRLTGCRGVAEYDRHPDTAVETIPAGNQRSSICAICRNLARRTNHRCGYDGSRFILAFDRHHRTHIRWALSADAHLRPV